MSVWLVLVALFLLPKTQNRFLLLLCPVGELVVLHSEIARWVIFNKVICSLPELLSDFEFSHIRVALSLLR